MQIDSRSSSISKCHYFYFPTYLLLSLSVITGIFTCVGSLTGKKPGSAHGIIRTKDDDRVFLTCANILCQFHFNQGGFDAPLQMRL